MLHAEGSINRLCTMRLLSPSNRKQVMYTHTHTHIYIRVVVARWFIHLTKYAIGLDGRTDEASRRDGSPILFFLLYYNTDCCVVCNAHCIVRNHYGASLLFGLIVRSFFPKKRKESKETQRQARVLFFFFLSFKRACIDASFLSFPFSRYNKIRRYPSAAACSWRMPSTRRFQRW